MTINTVITSTYTRTSGPAPLVSVADGSDTTSTQSSDLNDIYFEWDYGKSTEGSYEHSALPGASKNFDTGYIGATCYEEAGTPTMILTAYDGVDIGQDSLDITVTDADTYYSGTNTVCISTSGTFTGAPQGALQVTGASPDDLASLINSYLDTGKRVLFRGTERFSGAAPLLNKEGPWCIGSFGGGKAIFDRNGTMFTVGVRDSTFSNGVVMDVDCRGGGGSGVFFSFAGTFHNFTLLRVDASNGSSLVSCDMMSIPMNAVVRGLGVVECTYQTCNDANIVFVLFTHGCFLGNYFRDVVFAGTGEHIFRSMHCQRSAIRHNRFSNPQARSPGPGSKHCIALRSPRWAHTYAKLWFRSQTADFASSGTITNSSSPSASFTYGSGDVYDNGTTGFIHVRDVVLTGTFQDGDIITGSGGGSATVDGAMVTIIAANTYTERVVIGHNNLETGSNGTITSPIEICTSDGNDERCRDILVEKCRFGNGTGGSSFARGIWYNGQRIAFRNLLFDFTGSSGVGVIVFEIAADAVAPKSSDIKIDYNTIYYGGTGISQMVGVQIDASNPGPVRAMNNLQYTPLEATSTFWSNSGGSGNTQSNNPSDAQIQTSPRFDSSSPSSGPADFKLTTGSYAIGAAGDAKVFDDFFNNIRDRSGSPTSGDLGFAAFSTTSLPSAAAIARLIRPSMRGGFLNA